jgi:hypothetical protein
VSTWQHADAKWVGVPCSSGMSHGVLPFQEESSATIHTPNLGGGQAFLVALLVAPDPCFSRAFFRPWL